MATQFLGFTPNERMLRLMHEEIEDQLVRYRMRHEGDCPLCDEFWGNLEKAVIAAQKERDEQRNGQSTTENS